MSEESKLGRQTKYPDIDSVLSALGRNRFRSKFKLEGKDLDYLRAKGITTVLEHGRDFLRERLGPASPKKDGKQTPWRGHPVFVAQHATGTCCRGCLSKWHHIPRGSPLTAEDLTYMLSVIERWLSRFAND